MPDFLLKNGQTVFVEDKDVDLFLSKYKDQIASDEELLDPTTFQADAAAGADVVSQPIQAPDMELISEDVSLDSQLIQAQDPQVKLDIYKNNLKLVEITPEETSEIEAQANAAPTVRGVGMGGSTISIYPYDNFINEAKNELAIQNKTDVYNVPEDEWRDRAKQLYIQDEQSKLLDRKREEVSEMYEESVFGEGIFTIPRAKKFLKGLSITPTYPTKEEIEYSAGRVKISEEFKEEYQQATEEYNSTVESIKEDENMLNVGAIEINNLVEKQSNTPEEITQEDVDRYKKLISNQDIIFDSYNKKFNNLNDLEGRAKTSAELADLTRRTYNNLDVTGNVLKSTTARMVGGLGTVMNKLSLPEVIKRTTGYDISEEDIDALPWYLKVLPAVQYQKLVSSDEFKEGVDNFYKISEGIDSITRKRQELGEIKTIEDFGEFMLELFTEQSINTAVTLGTGGWGLAAVSASAGGNKLYEMDAEMKADPTKKYTAAQYYGAGILFGFAEFITEKVSLGQAKGALKYFGFGKNNFKKAFNLSPDYSLNYLTKGQRFSKALKNWGVNINKEGSAEAAAQILNNWTDSGLLDKDVSTLEGVGGAYISGSLMSGLGFNAPVLATDLARAFRSDTEVQKYNKRVERIFEIRNEMKKIQVNTGLNNDISSQEALKDLQNELDSLVEENLNDVNVASDRIDDLSDNDKAQLVDFDNFIFKQKRGIDKINNNNKLSNKSKKELINKNILNIEIAKSAKESILAASQNSKDKARQKSIQLQTAREAGLEFNIINAKNKEDAINQVNKLIAESNLESSDKSNLKQFVKALEDVGTDVNGQYFGAEFGLPIALSLEENLVANKMGATILHETGHATLFNKFMEGNPDAINLVKDMVNYVSKRYEGAKKKFADVDAIADRDNLSDLERAEEKMAAMLEYVSQVNIAKDKTFQGKLLDKWNKIKPKDKQKQITSIQTGKDVFDMINSFYRGFNKGELSGLAKKVIEGDVKVKQLEGKKVDKKPTDLKSRSIEASQKVQSIYEKQGKAGAFDIIEQFKPIVSKLVDRRSEAPNFDRQLLTDEIETGKRGILDLINEYKPESGVPLAAYINKFLPARTIEASKRVLGEEFTADVTEARGVVAAEVTDDVTVEKEVRGVRKPTETTRFKPNYLDTEFKKSLDPGKTQKEAIEDKISSTIKESFKDRPVSGFKQTGKIPQKLAQLYADMFGIKTTSALIEKQRNLQKLDEEGAVKVRQFLVDNAQSDFARLPRSKDDMGKATGILQTKIGKVLYDKAGKLTGSLKTYTDIIKGKNIILKGYDGKQYEFNKLDETGKKKPIYRDAQHIKAALDFHIRNRALETLIPEPAKRAQAGAMFSKKLRTVFDLELPGRLKINSLLTRHSLKETLDLKKLVLTEEGRKQIIETFKKTAFPLLPREAWLQRDSFTSSNANYGISMSKGSKAEIEAFRKLKSDINKAIKELPSSAFGKPIKGITDYKISSYNTVFKGNASDIKRKAEKFNKTATTIHRVMWERIAESISKDKGNASGIATFLKLTANDKSSYHRRGAGLFGYSPNPKGIGNTKFEFEHAMPATSAYLYLIDSAIVNAGKSPLNFKFAYDLVSDNYKVIALDKLENKKLGKAGLGTSMPKGWDVLNNFWWQRYFNTEVAKFEGGIDPASVVDLNGKSLQDVFLVNADGTPYIGKALTKSKAKASKVNNNKLPKSQKLEGVFNNNQVLEKMGKLDNEARDERIKFSKSINLDKQFNDIIEAKTGIASEKRYGKAKAQVAGASKGKTIKFVPYSAQDFVGLLYETLSKGKLGDAQMAWYQENLIRPFARAMNDLSSARLAMMNDYRALKKELKIVPKNLRKKIPGESWTKEQAVRVYIWNKQGLDIPGISKADLKDLTEYVANNAELQVFADQLIAIQKGDAYPAPKESWVSGSISTDLLQGLNTVKRAKYLEQWQRNVDEIFSQENKNKLQAAYGEKYVKALENSLQRMKTGRNRTFSDDSLTGRFTDWLQGSVGAIMFFNTRSALLQTISAVNFINFTDNNPIAAAKAFGNQKQYWKDFVFLLNSDFLKERRAGLRMNVSESDIADMAKQEGPRGIINKLLQLGFAPTQIADSFAIASGGATFYRNRVKTYLKDGLDQKAAEQKAFEDFRENAEESQQSSRPDRISMQQAGPLGRLILAFANTPAQYARLTDKAIRDLRNGRGDAKTNISKIVYYMAVQNLIFNAIQQALFAMAFGDEEEEDEKKQEKYLGIVNGMADSILRGTGFVGAAISVGKNSILRIMKEAEKKRPKFEKVGYELTKISPPISAKLSRINQAARAYQWNKEEMKTKGFSLDNPAFLAGGNVVSALTNIPLDRAVKKVNNVVKATDSDLELWERLALFGGWQDWEIGLKEETKKNKPQPRKLLKRKKLRRRITPKPSGFKVRKFKE